MSQDTADLASQHEPVAAPIQSTEDTEMTEAGETSEIKSEEQKSGDAQAAHASDGMITKTADQSATNLPVASPPGSSIQANAELLKHETGSVESPVLPTADTTFGKQPEAIDTSTQASEAQLTSVPTTIPEPASGPPKQGKLHAHESTAPESSAPNPALSKIQSRPASRAASVGPSSNTDHNTVKTTGAPARIYLKEQVNDWLLDGMRWIAHTKPQNGLASLGQYLTSADQWRHEAGNQGQEASNFQKYWMSYQTWKEKNEGKTEADFKAASRT